MNELKQNNCQMEYYCINEQDCRYNHDKDNCSHKYKQNLCGNSIAIYDAMCIEIIRLDIKQLFRREYE